MKPLGWQTVSLSLAGALDTQSDARASDPRNVAVARDVEYDESGGVQTRRPFGSAMAAIYGGGSIANARRIEANGDELVLFTDTQVYSWSSDLSAWVLRGTHLAVKIDEKPTVVTTGDQIDGDRAELNGTIVYVWTERTTVYAAAISKSTGAVIVQPTALTPVSSFSGHPKVVALSTKILLFMDSGAGDLTVRAVDPASPAVGFASVGVNVSTGVFFGKYDVVRIGTTDQCVGVSNRNPTTSYNVWTVTAGLSIVTVTKARDATTAAIAVSPTGTHVQVVRNFGGIKGDYLLLSTLTDVTVNQAIATGGALNIAACYRTIADGGQYRCYAIWSQENAGYTTSMFQSEANYVDTGGAIGTQYVFAGGMGVASRAFDHGGRVYVWMAFGKDSVFQGDVALANVTQAQNAFILYRDDGFIVAKSTYNAGAGFRASLGVLPGVVRIDGSGTYAWCATERRLAKLGDGSSQFAARSPREVTFEFDSNEARRCAKIGRTLYVAGGEILQYDGVRLTEVGFHFYPFAFELLMSGAGNIPNGTYAYKLGCRWDSATGERERSTTATVGYQQISAGPKKVVGYSNPITATHKTMTDGGIAIEVWRTIVNQPAGAPFYLATSLDPNFDDSAINVNTYIRNAPMSTTNPSGAAWQDSMTDAALALKEQHPENGNVLGALSPPAATIIAATDTRLFLTGIAGDPDRAWYSTLREAGQIASFNDALVVDVPRAGGDITATWHQDDVWYVARETAIYALPGVGFDRVGGGANYGPARIVSPDVGVIQQESVILTPVGTLFKSRKGWYLLERSGSVRYIGGAVSEFDGDTVLSAHVLPLRHHVRILTSGRLLSWEYRPLVDPTDRDGVGHWSEQTVADGVHATLWNNRYVYLTPTGPRVEADDYAGVNYGMDVETKWISLGELQSASKVRAAGVLGEYRSDHLLRIRAARDWEYDGSEPAWFDDIVWTPSPAGVGSALQALVSLSQWSMQALKLRLTAVADGARATLVTTALSPDVLTDGAAWTSTWRASQVGNGLTAYGELGNRLTMTISFAAFTPVEIEELDLDLPFPFESENGLVVVNDHFTWSPTLGKWVEDLDNIGVVVSGSLTVADLEAAIAEGTSLATLLVADPVPTKTVDVATMLGAGVVPTGAFTGGTFGTPTGEALKLTNLALEIGIRQGVNRRLPPEQKT